MRLFRWLAAIVGACLLSAETAAAKGEPGYVIRCDALGSLFVFNGEAGFAKPRPERLAPEINDSLWCRLTPDRFSLQELMLIGDKRLGGSRVVVRESDGAVVVLPPKRSERGFITVWQVDDLDGTFGRKAILVGKGKYKGRYLAVQEKGKARDLPVGVSYTFHPLTLTGEPGKLSQITIDEFESSP